MAYGILNIETSTKVCSVALSVDEEIVYEKEQPNGPSHAVLLGPFVKETLDFARNNGIEIHAVAVSEGPGSYTGLRIGVSEAKGLCFGMDIPLIAVPTLEILASQAIRAGYETDFFCPMIDARRMEVYAAVYNKQAEAVRPVAAEIISTKSYINFLVHAKVLFFGDGADKCKQIISSENAIFAENVYPLASGMAPLALKRYKENEFQHVAYFEPFYLKEFQATTPKSKI